MSAQECYSNDVIDVQTPGQSLLERIRLFAEEVTEARRKRRTLKILQALDDRQLKDIGVRRADIDQDAGSEFTRDLGDSYMRGR